LNNERIFEVRNNKQGTPMRIIRYGSISDIDVQFMDEYGHIIHNAAYTNFKNGQIKNPYNKTTYGVGYLGSGKYMAKADGKVVESYNVWHDMIRRCYSEKSKEKFQAYFHICMVSKLWHNYQNFAEWFNENKYEVDGRLHIDKDILYPGNKIYCPDTCLLVPQRINMLFLNKPNKRGLPNGIVRYLDRYLVKYNGVEHGYRNTLEDAFELYARVKKDAIIKIADEYKEIIPRKLYEALLKYDVIINADRNYVA